MAKPTMGMMPASLGPVERQSLRHTVRSRIEQAILRGELRGGQRLNEAEIAEALEVSRGPVREAIRELEASGLVESIPYSGTFVKEWTPKDVKELYTLRARLEEYAVELAVAQVTEADVEQLAHLLRGMYRAAQEDDPMELVELDMEFHRRLCAIAGHQLLLEMFNSLSVRVHMFIMATKAFYSAFSSLEEAAASHEPILEAITARDAEEARTAVSQHIREVGERFVQCLLEGEEPFHSE